MEPTIRNSIKKNQPVYHPVVPINPGVTRVIRLDLGDTNRDLTPSVFNDTEQFSDYLTKMRETHKADYLIGGYNEWRPVYSRSELFGTGGAVSATEGMEPRRLHIGTDIWGAVNTPVFVPVGGMVHSFAFNDHHGDYGATIVLLHQLDGFPFYTLYGHLGLKDIDRLNPGEYVARGAVLGHFGDPAENGGWPPHLHFQIILDMELYSGDYPGVCRYSEREKYLANCPDPDLILQMEKLIN